MDGLAQVQARIAAINGRFEPPTVALTSASGTDFESVLNNAIEKSSASRPVTPTSGSIEMPAVPDASMNGRLPDTSLVSIGIGGHRLSGAAASAFRSMRADAARVGVQIGVSDSYRTFDQQVDVAQRKGLYSQGGLAAAPGTSDHGLGLSLDVDVDGRGQEWLRTNGGRYGFVENVAREPWHWTYRPGGTLA